MGKRIQLNPVRRVFKKAIDENEKQIRFYQAKDRIILLMLKDMIGRDLDFSLNAVSPRAPQNPLNMPVEISEIIHSKTITHTCKRKDFSIFRKLLSDRRLSGLFQYFDSDIIPYEILRKELSDYERYKEQVFKTVFELEKQIIAVMSEEELNNLKATSGTNIQHKPYLDWLADYGILTREERAFCIEVRNKLSHNEFPDKAVMDTFVGRPDSTQTNIKQIVSAYITIVNTLIATKLLAKR